jgi:hypothetical protein
MRSNHAATVASRFSAFAVARWAAQAAISANDILSREFAAHEAPWSGSAAIAARSSGREESEPEIRQAKSTCGKKARGGAAGPFW